MEIRIKVPRMPHGLAANLLALAGLSALCLAVGGLTGNRWWAVLTGGVFAVAVAFIITTQEDAPVAPAPVRAIENGHKVTAEDLARDAAFMRGQATP